MAKIINFLDKFLDNPGDKYAILALIVIISVGVIYNSCQNNLLKKHGEYTNAVIYKFTKGGKNGRLKQFRYNYVVDGVKYEGWGEWREKYDTLSIGDTVIIMYNRKKPSHCRTKRDLKL